MRIVEEFYARGHPNVVAKHPTTFEITRELELSKRGDCVIAVGATKGLTNLSMKFRKLCRNDESRILVEVRTLRIADIIEGRGSRRLTLSHSSEMVGRKSSYVSDRTIMIRADKAACDVNRDLIDALTSPSTSAQIRITAEV